VESSFKEKFVEKSICRFHEQCTRPTCLKRSRRHGGFHCNPNLH